MYIKPITTDDEFDEVKNEWQDLEKKVNNQNITSSYIWQRTWWKHFKDYEERNFGHNKKLCILFLYNEEDELRAIAPFCEVTTNVRGLKYRTIEFLAQQWGATYLDIISDKLSKEECNFIFDWLRRNRKYDLVELRYIPEFSPNFGLYKGSITVLSACPEIISDSYDLVENNYYGKNLRHKLRRIRNKIKREGVGLTSRLLTSEQILDHFTEIKEVSISKELSSKHSLYRNTQVESFVRSLIGSYSENAMCSFIEYDGEVVAYNLGFEIDKKYYAWDAAYSRGKEELGNLSLGNLNYDLLIHSVFEKRIESLCLGTGIDPYKLKFSKQAIRIYTFLRRGNTLKGMPLYLLKRRLNQRVASKFEKELRENLERD
mgnify:CR=1 FL=1